MNWKATGLVAVLVGALGSTSCGYSLAGRGSFLPANITVIGIPTFVNLTPYYNVEQPITERVRSELIGRGKYKVLPQATDVDAVLTGTITAISVAPASFNQQQQASRYAITVVASIEFKDAKANKVLWQNAGLVFRDEYDLATATGGTVQDPSVFFGQEQNALERLSTDFARTVVSAILEAF